MDPTASSSLEPYDRPCYDETFRVVIIEPGSWGDAIKFSLESRCFDPSFQHSPYKALSYVWGANQVTETIQLDNCQVNVTLNLFCALYHLRHKEHRVIFWIDALVSCFQCIAIVSLRPMAITVSLLSLPPRTVHQPERHPRARSTSETHKGDL